MDLLRSARVAISAASNVEDIELRTLHTQSARSRLIAAKREIEQLEVDVSALEKDLVRRADAARQGSLLGVRR